MIKNATIPVLYPFQPEELIVRLTVADDVINFIQVSIHEKLVDFTRESDGTFKTADLEPDKSFLSYIERQLTRMFS